MEIIIIFLTILYLINAIITISCLNLIFSVFSLVFMFFFGVLLFLFVSAEYVMSIFLIVYLGAVIVIFLFVIMLLDVRDIDTNTYNINYYSLVIFSTILLIVFVCLCAIIYDTFNCILNHNIFFIFSFEITSNYTNVERIGFCLFYEFGFLLLSGGFIMMIVIIGCFLIIKVKKIKHDDK